jgi:hypothetical protein
MGARVYDLCERTCCAMLQTPPVQHIATSPHTTLFDTTRRKRVPEGSDKVFAALALAMFRNVLFAGARFCRELPGLVDR